MLVEKMFSSSGIFVGSQDPSSFDTPAATAYCFLGDDVSEADPAAYRFVANTPGAAANALTVSFVNDSGNFAELVGNNIIFHYSGMIDISEIQAYIIAAPAVSALIAFDLTYYNTVCTTCAQGAFVPPAGPLPFTGGLDATTPGTNVYVKTRLQLGDLSSTPTDPSAILEIVSATQGVLLPTAASVVAPATGLLRRTGATLQVWNGADWKTLINTDQGLSFGNHIFGSGEPYGVLFADGGTNLATVRRFEFYPTDVVDGFTGAPIAAGTLLLGRNNPGNAAIIKRADPEDLHGATTPLQLLGSDGSHPGVDAEGGGVNMVGGDGGPTQGAGGSILVSGGGSQTSNGGATTIRGGNGDTGGLLSLFGGDSVDGDAGGVVLQAGSTTNAPLGGDVRFVPGTSDRLTFASVDVQGIRFTAITPGPDGNNINISFYVDSFDPQFIVFGDAQNVYVSLDAEATRTIQEVIDALDNYVGGFGVTWQAIGNPTDTVSSDVGTTTGGEVGAPGYILSEGSLGVPTTVDAERPGLFFTHVGEKIVRGYISAYSTDDPLSANMGFGSPYGAFAGFSSADGPNNARPGPHSIWAMHLIADSAFARDLGAISQPWGVVHAASLFASNTAGGNGGLFMGASLQGPASYSLQTTFGGTTTTTAFSNIAVIPAFQSDLLQSLHVAAKIVGQKADGSKSAMFHIAALFRNPGNVATQVGTTKVVYSENSDDATYAVQFSSNGGNEVWVQAHGNGSSAETVYWQTTFEIVRAPFSG